MKSISREIVYFFQRQRFVVVSTVDDNGIPHNACKGIVEINEDGRIYLLDLYRGRTLANLKQNPNISITAVEEHKFTGYCLKGKARIIDRKQLTAHVINAWEKRIASRITHRLLKNIKDENDRGHQHHPESILPKPEYMISVKVSEIIDLMPSHMR